MTRLIAFVKGDAESARQGIQVRQSKPGMSLFRRNYVAQKEHPRLYIIPICYLYFSVQLSQPVLQSVRTIIAAWVLRKSAKWTITLFTKAAACRQSRQESFPVHCV